MIGKLVSLTTVGAMLICMSMAVAAEAPLPQDVPRMTKDDTKAVLGNKDVVIIDVRQPKDWDQSDSKIQGAVREDPNDFEAWAEKYPKDKTLLFYCS